MAGELAVRFNNDELVLIAVALSLQTDKASRELASAIRAVLTQEEPTPAPAPPEMAKVEYHVPLPANSGDTVVVIPETTAPVKVEVRPGDVELVADDDDVVMRSGTEQASFLDGSVVLRQRMSLHPIFGKIHPGIMQPDVFRAIFTVGATIAECESRLKDPNFVKAAVDGDPGDAGARVKAQQKSLNNA